MKSRLIVAAMLISLLGTSISSLAPAAIAFATSDHQVQGSYRSSAHKRDHSCCPHARARLETIVLALGMQAPTPCGDEHPCCAKSSPEKPSSLPASSRVSRPNGCTKAVSVADSGSQTGVAAAGSSHPAFYPSYHERSSVLRV